MLVSRAPVLGRLRGLHCRHFLCFRALPQLNFFFFFLLFFFVFPTALLELRLLLVSGPCPPARTQTIKLPVTRPGDLKFCFPSATSFLGFPCILESFAYGLALS